MIGFEQIKPLTGRLSLCAYDKRGIEVWRSSGHNMIVASGYDAILTALGGAQDKHVAKVAVGTNGTEPVQYDAQITDAVLLDIRSIEYPETGTIRFNFTVGYNDAVGMPIREFGLMLADGTLFSRKVRATIDKTEQMSIVGKWEISI